MVPEFQSGCHKKTRPNPTRDGQTNPYTSFYTTYNDLEFQTPEDPDAQTPYIFVGSSAGPGPPQALREGGKATGWTFPSTWLFEAPEHGRKNRRGPLLI